MTKEARGSFRSGDKMSRKAEGIYSKEVDAPIISTDKISGVIDTENKELNETYVTIRPPEEEGGHRSKNS